LVGDNIHFIGKQQQEIRYWSGMGIITCLGTILKEKAIQLLISLFKLIDQLYGRNSRVTLDGVGRRNENNADKFSLIIQEYLIN